MFSLRHFWVIVVIVVSVPSGWSQPPANRVEAVIVKPGESQSLATKSGKAVRAARSSNDAVQVNPSEQDAKSVVLRGQRPGVSRVVVTDADGTEETLAVVVEAPEQAVKSVRPALAKAMQDALKAERDPAARLTLAEGLIRVAPDDALAARELIETMIGSNDTMAADAYQAVNRVIVDSPPALVSALIPLLKDRDDVNRRRAAVLLLKIDPKALP